MGFISDPEFEFEVDSQGADTPPGSPRLAATHAQEIAQNFSDSSMSISDRVGRDYAALCCEEFGLNDVDKDDVIKVSQIHPQLIAVRQYARIVALNRNIIQLLTESFLESAEFKDHVTRRIQATFLDPTVPSYVRGCTSRLIQHMQENPGSWRIPPSVHAHFLNSKAMRKAVAAVASNFRGDLRRKIKKSIIDKTDIGSLAKKVCIKGYQPNMEFWRRLALLRCYMVEWEKLPCRPGRGRGIPYWSFIDSKLDKLKATCSKPKKSDTEAAMKAMLKQNLKDDQKLYPGPSSGRTKLPARIHIPDWQKDHSKAVQDMFEYTVEANPDEDVDEDDSTDNPEGGEIQPQPETEDRGHDGDTEESGSQSPSQARSKSTGEQSSHGGQGSRAGRVLVPGTQTSWSGSQPEPSLASNHASSPSPHHHSHTDGTQSTLASFVPETPPRTGQPISQLSGEGEQTSWASGSTLVIRRTRPSHVSSTTTPHAGPSSSSTARRH